MTKSVFKLIKHQIWNLENKYLKTDLDFFVENLDLLDRPCILITSDGDRDTPSSYEETTVNKILACDKITKWFTQNYDRSIINDKLYLNSYNNNFI